MDIGQRKIRWGVEQRLEFIEFRLFWVGSINRSDLTEQFGVSTPQASADLGRYEEKFPGSLIYDKSAKRYVPSASFAPQLTKPDGDDYLNRLKAVTDHSVEAADLWLSGMPPAESMPLPQRRVDVIVLRKVLDAVRSQRAVRVLYQSMNIERTEPVWRWISPHAFANDGLRWHVRAFCHLDKRFKDFLLSRCLGIDGDDVQLKPGSLDLSWHQYFDVVLVPNPLLSESQRDVVAQDYCMSDQKIVIPIRKSFLYYFRKRLRLDVAHVLDNVRETPVIVQNKEAFEKVLLEVDK
ncbi:WYL domain-containing protein [Terriglobus sp. RCC_193]|uniref:WYL domain-containing protein n=1 Tax=Terriglobus sp. RCC_193 TaxID=3239218 RepID=UPI003524A100